MHACACTSARILPHDAAADFVWVSCNRAHGLQMRNGDAACTRSRRRYDGRGGGERLARTSAACRGYSCWRQSSSIHIVRPSSEFDDDGTRAHGGVPGRRVVSRSGGGAPVQPCTALCRSFGGSSQRVCVSPLGRHVHVRVSALGLRTRPPRRTLSRCLMGDTVPQWVCGAVASASGG